MSWTYRFGMVCLAALLVSPPPVVAVADQPGGPPKGGTSRPTTSVFARDNLIDLGLDSMRAMTLASRWQAAGADV